MHVIGGMLFTMGMSQFGYQVWQWFASGSWPAFTVLNAFSELGLWRPYFSLWPVQVAADWLLDREVSLALLAAGAAVLFFRPVADVVAERRSSRVVAQSRKQLAETRGRRQPACIRMDFRRTS
ncbi:MAG: hypothetical protein H3C38_18450 [Rhodospirillales bacterium]|nr:hypothetical protein [Rhodospirillales bacterium]